MMMKGFELEVCCKEEGLEGAYFRAVLEENLTKSGRSKVCVRYMTLQSDDGSSPLTEPVQQRLLRPIPPEEEYVGVALEEGRVVDAYLRDGWWTGVIIYKKAEESNYLVYFDSPPDIIMFEETRLRAHVDWIDSKWVRPELKEVDKSMFCPGTMVEVSSFIDKAVDAWFPAMLIKEIEEEDGEKKFIVKDCNHEARPNTTVDPRRVRPTPPPFSVGDGGFRLMDCVEAFHGSVWRKGLVKAVLTGDCYKVCLVATKEEHLFSHSHVRPLKVWEDGAWHDGSKEESPSSVIKPKTVTSKKTRKHVRGSLNPDRNGKTHTKAETVAATGEIRNKKADAVMMNAETLPQVTSIAKESASVITPSPPVIAATPLKQTWTETEGEQSSEKTPEPQNGLANDSIRQMMPEEETSQVKSRKRRREHSDLNEIDGTCNGQKADMNNTSKDICNESGVACQPISSATEVSSSSSSHQTPNVMMMNSAAAAASSYGEETPPPALMALPFAKRSPYWKSSVAKEGYKTIPQHPHFSPLLEAKDGDHREWLAIGMMVTFYGLLEEVKGLKPDDSSSRLCSLSDSLVKLDKYGFDIDEPLSRIGKMMSLKDEKAKKEEEKQCLEKKVDEEEKMSGKLAEEMAEFKRKMLELQRQEEVAKEKKEGADRRVVEMKASGERIGQEIEDVDLEFLKTAAAPW